MACVGCGESVAAGARFCSTCGRSVTCAAVPPPPPAAHALPSMGLDGLYRPREGRMVAGVCTGFALRYGWNVSLVRLVLILSVLIAGVPAVAYLIAWVVMPNAQYALPSQVSTSGPGSMRV